MKEIDAKAKILIDKHEKELIGMAVVFNKLKNDYNRYRKVGQEKEIALNNQSSEIAIKTKLIETYREDFNIPKSKGKLTSIKRPTKKHIQKKRK